MTLPLKAIMNRYSVRNFSDRMPEDEKIFNILEAARLAPSWINVQPWHFIVVKDLQLRLMMAKLSHNQQHVEEAPVIIVCCGDPRAWEYENFKKMLENRPGITEDKMNYILNSPLLNPKLIDKETVMTRTIEEVSYATAYMTLEAYNQGLGACVIGAIGNEITKSIPEVYAVAKEELALPEEMFIVNLLAIGYPKSTSINTGKIRRPSQDIVSYNYYGCKSF